MNDEFLHRISCKIVGKVRTAGKIEFVKDTGPIRRDIRVKDFDWSPDCLRNLAKILWAAQRSHSYAISAYRLFSKMPSADFSPDGMLGGRGYIQNVKDMRSSLAQAVELMSSFTDTIHDEVNASHWKSAEDASPTVQPMMEDAEQVKANPDGFVEDEYGQVAPGDFDNDDPTVVQNPDADSMNPVVSDDSDDSDENENKTEDDGLSQFASLIAKRITSPKTSESKLPVDDSEQKQGKTEVEMTMHTTTPDHGSYASSVSRILKSQELRLASTPVNAGGNSSLPQGDLGGPRIDRVGPGEMTDDWASDDLTGESLGGGVNTSKPLNEDWCADGVSGYKDPTIGDESVLKISSLIASGYSWLPGADNNKMMPYYDRGVSSEDDKWMRENNKPDMPKGVGPQEPARPRFDKFWEAVHIE